MGAIYIMWLRQLKRYWRSKGRMIGFLGQPLLFLIALGFGFGPIYQRAGGGNYLEFLAPGVVAMTILFSAMFNGMEVIWDKQFGFLKETLVAPIPRYKIMLGRTFGGTTVSILQGLIVFAISLLIGFEITNLKMLPIALLFMGLIALLFTAVGIAIASKLEDMQAFPIIINFVIMPLFFLSGALFPLDSAPKVLGTISAFNPLSYGVDGVRGALSGVFHFGLMKSFYVSAILSVIAILIGTYLFSKVEV